MTDILRDRIPPMLKNVDAVKSKQMPTRPKSAVSLKNKSKPKVSAVHTSLRRLMACMPGHTLVIALMQDWKQENLIAPIKNLNMKGGPALCLKMTPHASLFRWVYVVRLMLSALPMQ